MGKSGAIANLLLLTAPLLIGIPILLMLPIVEGALQLWVYAAIAAYLCGIALFLAAKVSLFMRAHYFSWGSSSMTPPLRFCYRLGYALIAFALVIYLNLITLEHIR
jgi:hypothetical protein